MLLLTLLNLQFYYKIKIKYLRINIIMMIIIIVIYFILQKKAGWPVNMQGGAYNNKSVERSLYKKYYIIMIKICDKM